MNPQTMINRLIEAGRDPQITVSFFPIDNTEMSRVVYITMQPGDHKEKLENLETYLKQFHYISGIITGTTRMGFEVKMQ